MKKAYEEVKLAMNSEKHRYLSEETLQLCLEALREHEETKHNGYTNYPTWLIASYLDNNNEMYQHYAEVIKEICEENTDDFIIEGILTQTIREDFAIIFERIRLAIEDNNEGIFSSMLNYIRGTINWREIARSRYN